LSGLAHFPALMIDCFSAATLAGIDFAVVEWIVDDRRMGISNDAELRILVEVLVQRK
jgi:hypothetical protein